LEQKINLRPAAAPVSHRSSISSDQPLTGGSGLTRRSALRLLMGMGMLAGATSALPMHALAADHSGVDDAQTKLDEAQKKYDEVQNQLDKIGEEYEALAKKLSETLDKIEVVQTQIDETQSKIDKKQAEIDATQADIEQTEADIKQKEEDLARKKDVLSDRVAAAYKSGTGGLLPVLMSSSSFEELISNVYYLDRISEADARMIDEIKADKEALNAQKAKLEEQKAKLEEQKADLQEQQDELEGQKADLASLSEQQQQQLDDMKAKQSEVQDTLDGLSDDVKELIEKRDSEILAYNQAKKDEEARAAAAANAAETSSGSHADGIATGGGQSSASTGSQQAVVNACHSVGSPGAGYCAMWVSLVFQRAGYRYIGGDACDMYNAYCTSSNKNNLKVGMIVAVSSHSHTSAGRIYGHIGIYIGNGMMMDNIGYIRTISVDNWISYYSTTVTPRWGWAGDIVLS
jgi:peptidoglycan hydrolase CwlO-like protein